MQQPQTKNNEKNTEIQKQLHQLEEKLRQEGNIMSKAAQAEIMMQITDLREQIAEPAEKLAQMRQELVKLENRAAIFDPETVDYKIIANSIYTFQKYIKNMEQQLGCETLYRQKLQQSLHLELTKDSLVSLSKEDASPDTDLCPT